MLYYVSFCANGILETFLLANNTPILNHGQIHLQNKVFPSVFRFEEDQIFVKANLTNYSVRDCGADFLNDVPLYDGMFIEAHCQAEGYSYQILVQEAALLTLAHRFYYIEDEILVGSGEQCHIHSMLVNTLAHEHARFQKQGNRVVVSSLDTRVGVYVNGHQCGDNKRLTPGDMIWCMGLSIVFMGEYLAVSCQGIITLEEYPVQLSHFPPLGEVREQLERPPRVSIPLERGVVEIQAPTPKENPTLPVAVTAGPAFLMSLGMLISVGFAAGNLLTFGELSGLIASGTAAFTFLIGSLLWPSYISSQHKKHLSKREDKRLEKYSLYTEGKTRELEDKYNRNRKVWNDVLAPEPDKLVKMVEKYQTDHSLWERMPQDDDFLEIRVGLGSHDFEVEVKIPPELFEIDEDELKKYPQSIAGKYKTLKDVPEVVSIAKEKQIGVFGQKDKVYELLQATMIEIMALHNPDLVKVVCLFGEDEKEHFLWAKDLPALWSNDQSIRFMASNPEQAHGILRYLEHRITNFPNNETYVMLVTNQALLEQKLISRRFTEPGALKQVYSMFFEENLSALPKGCRATIRCNQNYGGLYCKRGDQNWFVKFMQDAADENTLINFQKAMLAVPFTLSKNHEEIVEKLGFLEMFHCGSVEDLRIEKRWLNHRSHLSLSAPLGQTTGEALFSLDIHEEYHGCHGLVVGDSDRDKTTLLQGLILSMMVCHSPRDFSVLLMEFSGSHFVTPFKNAPHVLGTVSTIPQCRGMMIPLRLEIQRRKRLFRNIAKQYELDSLDINGYQKFFLDGKVNEVITRIAVVVDEFLPLLREDPKLLEELLHLVKVGQLLGIHLILATATPSIVKDAHFASQFRVCLNLAHPDDMEEMVGMPPIHSLRHAGRCIVQVGQDEVFAEVQTGNCQLTYVKQEHFLPQHAQTIDVIDHAGQRIHRLPIRNKQEITDKTQLEAVIDCMRLVAEENDCAVSPFLYHEIDHSNDEAELVNAETVADVSEKQEEPVAYEEAPQYEEPVAYEETPEYEEPVAYEEAPQYEEPVAYEEAPQYEEPVAYEEAAEYEEPVAYEEAPQYEEPVAYEEAPQYEEPVAYEEAPEYEEPVAYEEAAEYEEPVAYEEAPQYEEPVAYEEAPQYEEPVAYEEAPQYEEPVAYEEAPQYEEPVAYEEAPEYEEPVAYEEAPQYEEPVAYEEATQYEEPVAYEEATQYEEPVAYEEAPQYEEPVAYEEAPQYEEPVAYEEAPQYVEYAATPEVVYEDAVEEVVHHPEVMEEEGSQWGEANPLHPVAEVYESPADFSNQFRNAQHYDEYESDLESEYPIPQIPVVETEEYPLSPEEATYPFPLPSYRQEEDEEVAAYPVAQAQIYSPEETVITEADVVDSRREAFLNRVNQEPHVEHANLTTIQFDQGLFVGGTQEDLIKNLLLTLAKFSKIDYVFSDQGCGNLSNLCDKVIWGAEDLDHAIEEIREHVWSMNPEKCVILIPSLHDFCHVATRRSMDRLTRLLKKHHDHIAVITGATAEQVIPHRDLDFLTVAVKQPQGIITNPSVLESLLPYLDQGLIPPTGDIKETDFLYYNEKSWKILYM